MALDPRQLTAGKPAALIAPPQLRQGLASVTVVVEVFKIKANLTSALRPKAAGADHRHAPPDRSFHRVVGDQPLAIPEPAGKLGRHRSAEGWPPCVVASGAALFAAHPRGLYVEVAIIAPDASSLAAKSAADDSKPHNIVDVSYRE